MDLRDELLLIEDDSTIVNVFNNCFKDMYIHKSMSAEEALDKLSSKQIHPMCIVLDYKLPGMDGLKFVKIIKNIDKYKYIPIILQSGIEFDNDIALGISKGEYYYLPKPYSIDLMKSIVYGAIKTHKSYTNLMKDSLSNFSLIPNNTQYPKYESWEKKILIFDNNQQDVALINQYLKNSNYKIIHRADKENIIEEIKKNHPDILLFGYSLTNKIGLSLFESIKRLLQNVPVIALINVQSLKIATDDLGLEVNEFLIKENLSKSAIIRTVDKAYNDVQFKKTIYSLFYKDDLTGLLNKKSLTGQIDLGIKEAKENNEKLAIIYIDIDNFKSINESYGHKIGDELLIKFSNRLNNDVLHPKDIMGRFGGDEFVIIIKQIYQTEIAIKTAEKILESLRVPFEVMDRKLTISVSMGICVYPDNGETQEDLLRKGDLTMYQVKKKINKSYGVYNDIDQQSMMKKMDIEFDLKEAISNQEFCLHYQPKINLNSEVIGFEALIRWDSPKRGVVPPNVFIPIIEETPLIIELGKWVLEKVIGQQSEWMNQGLKPLPIAINLSASQLLDVSILEYFIRLIEIDNVNPTTIEVEITESTMIKDIENTVAILNTINSLGIKIALDDFGTGFSSLNRLITLPIHTLKIDKSFINNILKDKNSEIIAQMILNLGKDLDIKIVAEGVESQEQFDYLINKGCDLIQGYFFSKPKEPHLITQYLNNV